MQIERANLSNCALQVVGVVEALARGSGGEPELREAMEILKVPPMQWKRRHDE